MKAGYVCKVCGADASDVEVRERAGGEDIVNYVHCVASKCGEHHAFFNPGCWASALDIKVPVTQNGIGVEGPPLTKESIAAMNREAKRAEEH